MEILFHGDLFHLEAKGDKIRFGTELIKVPDTTADFSLCSKRASLRNVYA